MQARTGPFRGYALFGIPYDPGTAQPLMRYMYNGITVGVRNGEHESDITAGSYDGPGRMKPDIVAQQNFTSFATPQVNAMGTLLAETALTWSGLDPVAARQDRHDGVEVVDPHPLHRQVGFDRAVQDRSCPRPRDPTAFRPRSAVGRRAARRGSSSGTSGGRRGRR